MNCTVPFALVGDGKRKLTTVRAAPDPFGAWTTMALAVPLGFVSGTLADVFTPPVQVANAYSSETVVIRRSDDTVNAIGLPCEVVPVQFPLKSSGLGRAGVHAHQIRIARPAASCHSARVNGRQDRIPVARRMITERRLVHDETRSQFRRPAGAIESASPP